MKRRLIPLILNSAFLLLLKYKLLILFVVFPIISLVEFAYILILKSKLKLKLIFGIFWDKDLYQYCRVCNKPLGRADYTNPHYSNAFCDKCKKHIIITDDNDIQLTIAEAKELI